MRVGWRPEQMDRPRVGPARLQLGGRVRHRRQRLPLQLQVLILIVLPGRIGDVQQEHVVGEGVQARQLHQCGRHAHVPLLVVISVPLVGALAKGFVNQFILENLMS